MKKFFLNPFEKYSEKQLFIAGVIFFAFGCLLGDFYNLTFDGAIGVHFVPTGQTLKKVVLENIIVAGIITFALFIFGKIINRKTRLIDVLNATLLFRGMIFLGSFIAINPYSTKSIDKVMNTLENGTFEIDSIAFLLTTLMGVIMISFSAYAIYLLFKGFKVATNMKIWYYYIGFAIILLITEFVAFYCIHALPQ